MEKEKYVCVQKYSSVEIQENEIVSFDKYDKVQTSFRVYDGGFVGIHYQQGIMSDEEGFSKAEKNLSLKREYPFILESGNRSRDLTKKIFSDEELLKTAKNIMRYLKKNYPDYIFNGEVYSTMQSDAQTNSMGMDYFAKDGFSSVDLRLKHKDSKDLDDGVISYHERTFSTKRFYEKVNLYLENFTKEVPMPEECIIIDQYYGFTSKLKESLDAENLSKGTSLLTGKIGQKVFSSDFTLVHSVKDRDSWMDRFWDGDGVVNKNDKVYFIKDGVFLRGFADKRTARKFNVKGTGNAYQSYTDIPKNGWHSMTIKTCNKSVKELLNGKIGIIPFYCCGGGFKEMGEYTMPCQIGLLTDGEKILGRVKPFTMHSDMFSMFGKDFMGVSKSSKLFTDKCILIRMDTSLI